MLKALLARLPYHQNRSSYQPLVEEDETHLMANGGPSTSQSSDGSSLRVRGSFSEKLPGSQWNGTNEHSEGDFKRAPLNYLWTAAAHYTRPRRPSFNASLIGAISLTIILLFFYTIPKLAAPSGPAPLRLKNSKSPQLFFFPASKDHAASPGKQKLRKALVVASFKNQNVTWLRDLANVDNSWEVYRYVADLTLENQDKISKEFPDVATLNVARHDGREALAYLTFIVDNYDNLPDKVFFIHGHRYAWHQPAHIVDLLTAFNMSALQEEGFISLRCALEHGCVKESMYYFEERPFSVGHEETRRGKELPVFWEDFLVDELGPLPPMIGRPCCAQFAVTRSAIKSRSLDFWKKLKGPLSQTEKWRSYNKRPIGLFMEMVWHILMGKNAVHCPPADYCRKVYFQDQINCACDGVEPCRVSDDKYVGWQLLNCTSKMRDFPLDSERDFMREKYQKGLLKHGKRHD